MAAPSPAIVGRLGDGVLADDDVTDLPRERGMRSRPTGRFVVRREHALAVVASFVDGVALDELGSWQDLLA